MNEKLKKIINQAVSEILKNSSSDRKLNKILADHNKKIHFIPKKYRVFGGILQSMNIQFGNFLEKFITLLIASEERYEILDKYSGVKSNKFHLSKSNDERIDKFITTCQVSDINLEDEFEKLLNEISSDKDKNIASVAHDIDILFKDKETEIIYYLEVKYNDDHDTGKFVDINRKFIKTYAYLVREFPEQEIRPILFFFNNKKLKGNIYIPENTHIRRGKKFFDEFLNIKYEDVDYYMKSLSESDENINAFNELYEKVMSL